MSFNLGTKLSETDQIELVRCRPDIIELIDNPSEAVQMAVVDAIRSGSDSAVLKLIKCPTEAVQIAAVSHRAGAISYLNNQTEAAQIIAVRRLGASALFSIRKPSKMVRTIAKQVGMKGATLIKL